MCHSPRQRWSVFHPDRDEMSLVKPDTWSRDADGPKTEPGELKTSPFVAYFQSPCTDIHSNIIPFLQKQLWLRPRNKQSNHYDYQPINEQVNAKHLAAPCPWRPCARWCGRRTGRASRPICWRRCWTGRPSCGIHRWGGSARDGLERIWRRDFFKKHTGCWCRSTFVAKKSVFHSAIAFAFSANVVFLCGIFLKLSWNLQGLVSAPPTRLVRWSPVRWATSCGATSCCEAAAMERSTLYQWLTGELSGGKRASVFFFFFFFFRRRRFLQVLEDERTMVQEVAPRCQLTWLVVHRKAFSKCKSLNQKRSS